MFAIRVVVDTWFFQTKESTFKLIIYAIVVLISALYGLFSAFFMVDLFIDLYGLSAIITMIVGTVIMVIGPFLIAAFFFSNRLVLTNEPNEFFESEDLDDWPHEPVGEYWGEDWENN